MRLSAFKLLLCCIGLFCYSVFAYAQNDLRQRQQSAQIDRQELQKQIKSLQNKIAADESQRNDIAKSLKDSEEKISQISKILFEYEQRNQSLEKSLLKLTTSKQAQQELLQTQQAALAKQLKAQYASGLSPWTALLSGKDPQDISRDLSYMAYVLRARLTALEEINTTSKRLNELSEQILTSQTELQDLQTKSKQERDNLVAAQAKHKLAFEKIKDSLKDQQKKAAQLASRDQVLAELIKQLDQEIKQAARAAKKRQQELLKEQARKQAAAQKAAEQKVAAQKLAEQKVAEQKAQEQSRPVVKSLEFEPEGGFKGLKKGLTAPVKGQALGRFGSQRPEGGVWRGIVLRTEENTNIHAVADGKVVYSAWLSGFGNLLIIDHGQGYLSIYGYNKANIKDVGDLVANGEVIATVGATGGQVEPGLYFELRHNGAPINPQLWLKP